ncbi:hypothetical protein LCGC14_0546070 [marine sediment metagenome]|uniref:LSM domain-containing protein n=1 Tax=marine sediment metagenome TaxID=412755 RepID=A0A0F9S9T6_9ZZZZ
MDLTIYLNKKVQIILTNEFTYIGKCISADEDSITIIDKNNSNVSLKKSIIATILEVGE